MFKNTVSQSTAQSEEYYAPEEFDITELYEKNGAKSEFSFAMLLPSGRSSYFYYASKEHTNESYHPTVLVEFEDIEVNYSYAQTAQIGLIEPWNLKANLAVIMGEEGSQYLADYSTFKDYGAYFIRKSELGIEGATQDNITAEDIIGNEKAVKKSHLAGEATIDGDYLTATYDKGIYTYEMSDSVFVQFYFEDAFGVHYAPIRERNIKDLLDARKNNPTDFPNELERNVYTSMSRLESDVLTYRAQFDEIAEVKAQDAPTLAEYVAANGAFEAETVEKYDFWHTVQLILIEPWGLKLNAYALDENEELVDYTSVEEYGTIVYYDTEDKISGTMTADELMSYDDAYVFSSKNGDAEIDGSYMTALYNKGIYTYQLDSNAYVMFYIKDEDGYHYGDVKVRNAYQLAKARSTDTSGDFSELEKIIYADMVDMYDRVNTYRDDYFSKN